MQRRLEVSIVRQGRARCTVALAGALDMQTYQELEETFTCLLAEGRKFIRVDLGGLTRIQSCAFGVFIDAMAALEREGGNLSFANPGTQAQKIFRLLGAMVDYA